MRISDWSSDVCSSDLMCRHAETFGDWGNMNLGLVVEDQPALACWLGETLPEAFPGISVRSADTLAGGRAAVSAPAPDIALIALGITDGSGIDLISELADRSEDRRAGTGCGSRCNLRCDQ